MISKSMEQLSSTSYTKRDFEAVYSELLDLVKVLTTKWDPSISNESDPGVILLKLNAIIADKCNYNADKNVLECFPLSVSQLQNARQLFGQLGYYMHGVKSATTQVSLKWIDKVVDYFYTIPPFTMVSNEDKDIVYTLIGPASVSDKYNVSSQKLMCDSQPIVFDAIQGIAVNYAINGETNISASYLDRYNRLYFDGTDIAENGIFITNTSEENYSSWVRVDNLVAESLGNNYYKIGLSDDGSYCYIEFPEDAPKLFKDGINITYIRSNGVGGNIRAKELTTFYNDVSVIGPTGESMTLSSENVSISNPSSAVNGQDEEDIDEAYTSYLKVVGTFSTLVTLRDYINYILRSDLVSNGFVCDRTNDIQSTYKIMTQQNDVNQLITQKEKKDDQDELSAYALKMYLLQYSNSIDTYADVEKTFNVMKPTDLDVVKNYLSDVKSIQHDFVDILPRTPGRMNVCYFKNRYDLAFDIVPQYSLTPADIEEVKASIKTNLYRRFQAKNLQFGQEINYEDVVAVIEESDARIKFARVSPIEYETFAVCFDGTDFYEVDIGSDVAMTDVEAPEGVVVTVDRAGFEHKIGVGNYSAQTFMYTSSGWKLDGNAVNLSDYGISVQGTLQVNDEIIVTPSFASQIREEIYAKSVLAGVTQLLVKDEDFEYTFQQTYTGNDTQSTLTITDIANVSSNVDIVLNNTTPTYTLRDNETIQLYSPSMIDVASYGDYVKFEYYLKNDLSPNVSYQLQADEYVIFYWKDTSETSVPYSYAMYGRGNVIRPTFDLTGKTSEADIVGSSLKSYLRNTGSITSPVLQAFSDVDGGMTLTLSQRVADLDISHIMYGKNKVFISKVNQVTLDSTMFAYWMLNNSRNGRYVLFDEGTSTPYYMLNTGEYFFYTDKYRGDLAILGAGTRIEITDTSRTYSVPVLNKDDVLENGVDAIQNSWFVIPSGTYMKAVETYYLNLGPGSSLQLTPIQPYSNWTATFSSSGITYIGGPQGISSFNVQYKLSYDDEWTLLQQLSLAEQSGWSGRSLLGINLAEDIPQILYANQALNYKLASGQQLSLHGADVSNSRFPVCVLTSRPLSMNGAQDIDVSYELDGKKLYMNMYVSGVYESAAFTDVSYTSANEVIVTCRQEQASKSCYFDFLLPDGEYIVTVNNPNSVLSKLQILLDGVNLKTVASELSDLYKRGNYNLYMNIDNTKPLPSGQKQHRITVLYDFTDAQDVNIVINNPYRYTMPETFSAQSNGHQLFQNIQELVAKLDVDSVFDWAYVVNESAAIENPLDPRSFLRGNHIYNSYSLCQINPIVDKNIGVVSKR